MALLEVSPRGRWQRFAKPRPLNKVAWVRIPPPPLGMFKLDSHNLMLVAGAAVFRKAKNGRISWFLVRDSQSKRWEMPKALVRKGESSVRTILRVMGEQGGMNCRIIEEAGRIEDKVEINGKSTGRRIIYYLVLEKSAGEVLGFEEYAWVDFSLALRKLGWEREKQILKSAKDELEKWVDKKNKAVKR